MSPSLLLYYMGEKNYEAFFSRFIERRGFANLKPKGVYQLKMKNMASEM